MTYDTSNHTQQPEKTWFEKRRDLKGDSSFELNGVYYPYPQSIKNENGKKTYRLLDVEYCFENGKLHFLKDRQ